MLVKEAAGSLFLLVFLIVVVVVVISGPFPERICHLEQNDSSLFYLLSFFLT
jgi:hypothetical protein